MYLLIEFVQKITLVISVQIHLMAEMTLIETCALYSTIAKTPMTVVVAQQ